MFCKIGKDSIYSAVSYAELSDPNLGGEAGNSSKPWTIKS